MLIALRFYASGSFLQIIGDTIGVEKSTVSRVVTSVSWVLVAKQQQYIKWPKDQQELGSSSTNVEGFLASGIVIHGTRNLRQWIILKVMVAFTVMKSRMYALTRVKSHISAHNMTKRVTGLVI